jgi:hypothetical protein
LQLLADIVRRESAKLGANSEDIFNFAEVKRISMYLQFNKRSPRAAKTISGRNKILILDKSHDLNIRDEKKSLVIGDPISVGPKKWSWKKFGKMWSGIVIVCY